MIYFVQYIEKPENSGGKRENMSAVVTLKKGEGRVLKSGGLWVYDNEIDTIMGHFENGDIVIVLTAILWDRASLTRIPR